MRIRLLWLLVVLGAGSCRHEKSPDAALAEASGISEELVGAFPLLPVIERDLWSRLSSAEASLAAAQNPEAREQAAAEVERLADKLRELHPFRAGEGWIQLGGIVHHEADGRISIPARVNYPDPGDERHPGEVEVLLCSEIGRRHETLFVTRARPLHLELLLHLAGYAKGTEGSRFRIEIRAADGVRIGAGALVRDKGSKRGIDELVWIFSGSDFRDLYSPDLSGDFAIFWHAHDSVLRAVDEEIASGVRKLRPKPHPLLPEGHPVSLDLIPLPSGAPGEGGS